MTSLAQPMPDASTPLPPMRLGEVVLRTSRYEEMKSWYSRVLCLAPASEHRCAAGQPAHAPLRICFFRLHADHPYQNVIALFELAGCMDSEAQRTGLHHMQLGNASVPVLQERYRRLRNAGIRPFQAMNHGPTSSLYYRDPDRNVVEIAASNFATLDQARAALASDTFLRNPAGEVLDVEEWAAQVA